MTDEEMADEYAHNHIHYEVAKREDGTDYAKEVSSVTVEQAFLAGLEAGKPKWHKVADGDLPPVNLTVLNEDCDKVIHYGKGKWEAYSEYYEDYIDIEPPVAWCEKPEYKEAKQC